MSRSVEEWIGKNDNEPVPDRVRVRVFLKFDGVCQECNTKIIGKRWICDHRTALINGGANRENNLGPIHEACDKTKTASDVAEKSTIYRKRKKHIGVKKRSQFPCSKDSPFKKKIGTGEVVRR